MRASHAVRPDEFVVGRGKSWRVGQRGGHRVTLPDRP
jgi:hypothetical protein